MTEPKIVVEKPAREFWHKAGCSFYSALMPNQPEQQISPCTCGALFEDLQSEREKSKALVEALENAERSGYLADGDELSVSTCLWLEDLIKRYRGEK